MQRKKKVWPETPVVCIAQLAMQFSCKSPLHYSRCYASSKQLQLLCLAMSTLLCILVSPAGSSDCPSTCTPNECPRLRPRNCVHRYRDACNCCEYCGMGPGELCEGLWNQYGFCAAGLECVKTIEEGLPREQQEQLPGTCRGKKKYSLQNVCRTTCAVPTRIIIVN